MSIPERPHSFATSIEYVGFAILADDRNGGQLPDWSQPVNRVTHLIPGSFPPQQQTDIISFGPSEVTWRLWLRPSDVGELRRQLGATGTLTVLAGLQSHPGVETDHGDYTTVALAGTTLTGLANRATLLGGNGIEVDATFSRLIDPRTGTVQ